MVGSNGWKVAAKNSALNKMQTDVLKIISNF